MNNDCDKYKGDSAKMWKVINESMNKKPKSNTYPDFVEARNADGDTVRIRDKKEIANVMNKQFVEMGAKLAEKLPPTTTKFTHYLNSPSITSMFLQKASESEVGKHFHEININKGVGIDEIPPKLLKWGEEIFIPIITHIFNKCLSTGIYPDDLKLARVIPVFKGGSKNAVTTYRPISILTQFNRIFEKLLKDRLYNFLGKKIYKKQFGFQPKHSTEQT